MLVVRSWDDLDKLTPLDRCGSRLLLRFFKRIDFGLPHAILGESVLGQWLLGIVE